MIINQELNPPGNNMQSAILLKKPLNIGGLIIESNLVLAPMAGVTDRLFRKVVRSFPGCGLTFSELVSSEGIVRNQPGSLRLLETDRDERPFGIQIYGARPDAMARAARMAESFGCDLVDINVGCPARKVVRNQGGSYLLKEPELLKRIITEVRSAVNIPVTIKIRSGFDENSLNFLEIGRMAEDCGINAITLHPRTRAQMFSGHSQWDHIRRLRERVTIPVIGNGDIFQPEDAREMFLQTRCDGVMIGRGIMKNPWLISQVAQFLETGFYNSISPGEKLGLCLQLVEATYTRIPEPKILGEMKKFCSWLINGFHGAAQHRQELYNFKDPVLLMEYLRNICNCPETE